MNLSTLPPAMLAKINDPAARARLAQLSPDPVKIEALKRVLENKLQKQIADYLRQRPIWFDVSRMNRKTTNTIGRPDFLLCHKGRSIGMEVKRSGEKPTEQQLKCMDDMRASGWLCFVVYGVADVKAILDNL